MWHQSAIWMTIKGQQVRLCTFDLVKFILITNFDNYLSSGLQLRKKKKKSERVTGPKADIVIVFFFFFQIVLILFHDKDHFS